MRQPVPFGKYLLLDRISVGGMAEVFKAKSYGVEGFEKIIAIKRILPTMGEDRDFIKMFIDEAKIAGQLAHSNICQIFELGRIDGSHFIAMEFIWGKDLLQLQNRLRKLKQPMNIAMACFIIAKVCEGLDYAHRKRDQVGRPMEIVHRDCSPQNVLVSYEGEVKVIDFGIAKATSRTARTQAGVLKGKFGYMSPEQVRGLPLDRRSDIFALGTMLFECLTGQRLFQGETDFATLEKVRNVSMPQPRAINPDIPEAVEKIILKSLTKDVDDRYSWCSDMLVDLQAYLMSQSVVFTAKTMAAAIKELFTAEVDREKQQLEQYKKMGRDGLIGGIPAAEVKVNIIEQLGEAGEASDPTMLGGPTFEEMEAATLASTSDPSAGAVPKNAVVGPGSVAAKKKQEDDFVDEVPTEIFGDDAATTAEPQTAKAPAAPPPAAPPPVRRTMTNDIVKPRMPTADPARPRAPTRSGDASANESAPPLAPPPIAPPIAAAATNVPPPIMPASATTPTVLFGNNPMAPPPPYATQPPPMGPGQGMPSQAMPAQPMPGQQPPWGQSSMPLSGPNTAANRIMGGSTPPPNQPGAIGQPMSASFAPPQYGQGMPPQYGQAPMPPQYGQNVGLPPQNAGQTPARTLMGMAPPNTTGQQQAVDPATGFAYGTNGAPAPYGMQPHGMQPHGMQPHNMQSGNFGFPMSGAAAQAMEPPLPAPVMGTAKPSSRKRDVIIGVAIALFALTTFLIVKFVVLGGKKTEPTTAPTAGLATLKIAASACETASKCTVLVDDKPIGSIVTKGEFPVNAGNRTVQVKDAKGVLCTGSVELAAGKQGAFDCVAKASSDTGSGAGSGSGSGSGSAATVAQVDGTAAGSNAGSSNPVGSGAATGSAAPTPPTNVGSAAGSAAGSAVVPPVKPLPVPVADGSGAGSGSGSGVPTKPEKLPPTKRPPDHLPPEKPAKPETTEVGTLGYLLVFSEPKGAKVFVDGSDTGKVTPLVARNRLELSPGKHRITLQTDSMKNTYPVLIKAGATETLSKELK